MTTTERASIGVDFFTLLIADRDVSDRGKFACELVTENEYFAVAYLPSIEACGIRVSFDGSLTLLLLGNPTFVRRINFLILSDMLMQRFICNLHYQFLELPKILFVWQFSRLICWDSTKIANSQIW